MSVHFRVSSTNEDWSSILSLLQRSFAYMNGRIDPPSSLADWTEGKMATEAASGFVIIGEDPQIVACAFARPHADTLYLGKIAIAESHRRQGILRQMLAIALSEARRSALPTITLQTRVELTENHAAFKALGFAKTGETTHPGFTRPTSITMRCPV